MVGDGIPRAKGGGASKADTEFDRSSDGIIEGEKGEGAGVMTNERRSEREITLERGEERVEDEREGARESGNSRERRGKGGWTHE